MISIPLRDGCFKGGHSAGLGGEAIDEAPATVAWQRCNEWGDVPGDASTVVFTDVCLDDVEKTGSGYKKIAWLIEPPGCGRTHYAKAARLEARFDHILSFDRNMVFTCDMPAQTGKWMFCPFGGSWIRQADWGVYVKSKNASIIASAQAISEGHKLRHSIIREYPSLDVWGKGYRPVASKLDALAEYRYSVVVEAWRGDYYFSEKLLDCFATGTIPIYWGCPSIGKFFDERGIITFYSLEGLRYALEGIGEADYMRRMDAIRVNLDTAKRYRCPEDWITANYPNLLLVERK